MISYSFILLYIFFLHYDLHLFVTNSSHLTICVTILFYLHWHDLITFPTYCVEFAQNQTPRIYTQTSFVLPFHFYFIFSFKPVPLSTHALQHLSRLNVHIYLLLTWKNIPILFCIVLFKNITCLFFISLHSHFQLSLFFGGDGVYKNFKLNFKLLLNLLFYLYFLKIQIQISSQLNN